MSEVVSKVDVRPAAGHLGAVVRGVDLRVAFTPDELDEVRALLDDHLVLVFPDQELDDDQQLAFALQFGGPYIHPLARGALTEARCEHIVDDVEHPPYQDEWHTDVSWDDEPPCYGTLRAVDLPSRGGDTIWASMYGAYDGLSPLMQEIIEPLSARHFIGSGQAFVSKAGAELVAQVKAQHPGVDHPVVGVHPRTGRRYLNVNRGFTEALVGLTPGENAALLPFLTGRAAQPNLQFRHQWTLGDVVIWDERSTQHFAVADYMPERREMGRAVVR